MNRPNNEGRKVYIYVSLALIGLLTLILLPSLVAAQPMTAKQQLERAWRFAISVGVYDYATDATQTSHPTARLENAGRHPRSERLQVEGAVNIHDETMSLRLWGQDIGPDGLELKIEDGQAYGRLNTQEEWTEIDNPTNLFAPNGDPLGFLAAADNIQYLDGSIEEAGPEAALSSTPLPTSYSRYRFDIDGPRYAEYIRAQMQTQMTQSGELPPGLTIGVIQQYVDMTGWGEIWLDEVGLPVRQVIHLEFPPQKDALDWYEANIVTTFSGWDVTAIEHQLFWAIPRLIDDPSLVIRDPLSLFPASFTPADLREVGLVLGLSLLLVGLGLLAFTYRRSPKLYAAVALATIVSMLVTPLLQVDRVHAFYERQHAHQLETEQSSQTQEPAAVEQAEDDFNPTINPLTDQPPLQTRPDAARPSFQRSTADCQSNVDTDGDGLNDDIECYQLGTFPDDVDSDGDGISDKTEVVGFYNQWYLDPLNFDSNGDGFSDMAECPALIDVAEDGSLTTPTGSFCGDTDQDGVPDVFDFDNDGDGVPDRVDSAPSYRGDLTINAHNSFDLSLSNYDTTNAGALVVEFDLRPKVYEHLFQTNNVFDWPSNDTQGQITRVHDTTLADLPNANFGSKATYGDMVVMPMLEIKFPAPSANSANPSGGLPIKASFSGSITNSNLEDWLDTDILKEYSIAVNQDADSGEIFAYIPLTQKIDTVGNTPVAWTGQMLYRPQDSSWGQNHEVRQVWLVEAAVDQCDTTDMTDTFTYTDDQGNTQTIAKRDADAYQRWCENDTNWDTRTQIIQTYYEDFYLTGLVVREDYNFEMAVIAQNNALSQPYENYLWHLSNGLAGTFGEGRRLSEDGPRFDIDEIVNRFSPSSSAVWDIPQGTFSLETAIGNSSYDNQTSAMRALAETHIPNLLTTTYAGATNGVATTLLIAREETFKTTTLDNDDSVNDSTDNTLVVNLSSISQQTFTALNWSPYQYQSGKWTSTDLYDYQDALENQLENAFDNNDVVELLGWFAESSQNAVTEKAALIGLARNYYTTMFIGSSAGVYDSELGILNDDVVDETIYDLDFDDDGQADEAALFLVAGVLDSMRSFFASEGDILLDEIFEILGVIGEVERILDAQDEGEDPTLTQAKASAKATESLFKKLIKRYIEGGDKWYKKWKGRSLAKHGVTGIAALAGFLVSDYAPFGSKDNALLYASTSLMVSAEALSVAISVKDYFYAKSLARVDPSDWAANLIALERTTKVAAVVGFVVDASIATLTFILTIQDLEPGSQAFNYAVAEYVAALIVAVVYAVISATVIGAIIIGIISLIDIVITSACLLVREASGQDIDEDVDAWVCRGITGAITKSLAYGIYDTATILNPADEDRLTIALKRPELTNREAGFVVGNSLNVGAVITNSIKIRNNLTAFGYTDLHALFTFFQNDTLKQSTFAYTLQNQQTDRHHSLSQDTLSWPNNTEVFKPDQNFTLSQAGINQNIADIYLTEAFNIPSLECWGFLIQKCVEKSYKDSFHYDWTNNFTFDILPNNFGGFIKLAGVENYSYRQAWSEKFPTLTDADGDGLVSQEKGGPDPNDSTPDSDKDGLTDFWEYANGYDANEADGDDDGLSDYWEVFYGTNPRRPDTDGDGLWDGEEFFRPDKTYPYEKSTYSQYTSNWTGGWTIVYDYNGNQPLQTRVSADPTLVDADGDFIPDDREQIYGYNPNLAEELNVLGLQSSISSGYVAPSGTVAYTATVKNELDNRAIDGLLQVEFPVDVVQSSEGIGSVYPQISVTTTGSIQAPAVAQSEVTSFTIRAGAAIDDVSAVDQVFALNFDESSGTTFYDSTSVRRSFTCTSGTCPTPNAGTATFNRSGIITPHHDDFNQTTFSVKARVKPTADGLGKIYEDHGDFQLRMEPDNGIGIYVNANSNYLLYRKPLALNEWTTIIVTVDRTRGGPGVKLYLNGTEIDHDFGGFGPLDPFIDAAIEVGGGGFQGEIDEVTLYNYILTEDEIRADFSDLTFYANFEQNGCGNYLNYVNLEPITCNGSPQSTPNIGITGQGTGEGNLFHSIPFAYPFTGDDNSFSVSMWYKETLRAPTVMTNAHTLLRMGEHQTWPDMFRVDLYGDPIDENNMKGTLDLHVALNGCLDGNPYDGDNEEILLVDDFLPWDVEGWNHLAFTYDGREGSKKFHLYHNNQLIDTVTCTYQPRIRGTRRIDLGVPSLSPSASGRSLDEVRMYSKALSEVEIDRLYHQTNRSVELSFDAPPGQSHFASSSLTALGLDGASCLTGNICPDSGIPGRNNQAVDFDASQGEYLTLDARADKLGLTRNGFTVMAWVKGDHFGSGSHTILGTDSTDAGHGLQLSVRNGQPYMSFSDTYDATGSTILNPNQWYHLAWRFTPRSLAWDENGVGGEHPARKEIFVDGVQVGSAVSANTFAGTGDVHIGRSLGGNTFDGLIDHLVIVQDALTEAEIRAIMQDAPLLNLHLDEDLNTTSFVDDSPYQNGATCTGDACPAAGTKGQMREAPRFDGNNDLLTVDGSGELKDLAQFTVGLWVKPTRQINRPQYLIAKEATNGLEKTFSLVIPANSMHVEFTTFPIWYEYCFSGWDSVLSDVPLQENVWNHILVTYDTHRAFLYVNGAEQGSKIYSTAYSLVACEKDHPISIGGDRNGGHGFAGQLDEVTVFNHALTPLEAKTLYDYQAAWYDTKNQHRVVIDADPPLVSVDAGDNYLNLPTLISIFATDPSSLVAKVDVTITAPGGGQTTTTYSGNGNGDWIVEFSPSGGGAYTIEAMATDAVGNTSIASKTVYVDATPPAATLDSSLTSDIMTTIDNGVSLFGTISDPGSPATGVATNTVSVEVQDWRDVSLAGLQSADFDGSGWSVDYPFSEPAYGQYDIRLSAADAVGNVYTGTVGTIELDDLGPYADLMLATTAVTSSNGILQGVVSDIPYPVQGKLLHLHFEEADGPTFADSSGNGFATTCVNCPTAGSNGQNGNALAFDGANDALTISANQNLVLTDTTMMVWVRPAWSTGSNGYNPTLLAMDDGSQTGYRWQIGDDYQSLILDNGNQSESMPVDLVADQWVHLALTVENGLWTSYMNGISVGTITQTLGSQIDLPLQIGSATGNSGFFNGLLDEVVVYDTVLSAEMIYDIANPLGGGISDMQIRLRHLNGSVWPETVNPEGLALYLPFDDDAGTTSFDIAGANNLSATCGSRSCPTTGQNGYRDGGFLFEGNDTIVISDESTFDFEQMTIAAWIKLDDFDKNYASIVSKDLSWSLMQDRDLDTLVFVTEHAPESQYSSGKRHSLRSSIDVADGEWHFVAAVYDGHAKYLYVDNVLDVWEDISDTHNPELLDFDRPVGVSDISANTRGFNGLMDEVVIFNRALDQDELDGLRNTNPWQTVTLDSTTDNFTTWQYPLPTTLEGPYSIDLEATDQHDHTTRLPNAWFGDIDVAGPRLTFTYDAVDNQNVRAQCDAEDLNLTDAGWVCPATGLTHIPEDADWFLNYFSPVTRTGRLTTTLQTLNTASDGTMTACDLFNNCTTLVLSPTPLVEASTILTPTNGAIFTSRDPIIISGLARSGDEIESLQVTANGQTIYATTWNTGTTEATWSTAWTPPAGTSTFTLEAIVTNGMGQQFDDPAETIISVFAPSLTLEKSVNKNEAVVPGEPITYTITLANNGTADIQDVLVSDNLPVGVAGTDLSQTVSLSAGQSSLFTIPVVVTALTNTVVANTATFSHALQSGADQATFRTCIVDQVVQNGNDSGSGSLKQALRDACEGGTITFASDLTINAGNSLSIYKSLTIDATGHNVTLDGQASGFAFLSVYGNTGPVILKGLKLVNGSTEGTVFGFGGPGPVTIIDSTFDDNFGADFDNPMLANHTDLTFIGSTFTRNGSPYGIISNRSGGTLTILNSTFSDHQNIYTLIENESGSVVTITHSTLVDYFSQFGSGLTNNGQMTIANSIIAGSGNTDCSGTITDGGYNLVGSGGGCPTDSGTSQTIDAANLFSTALAPLGDNGGKTQTHALHPANSSAFDAIPAGTNGCGTIVTTDQRGVTRPQGSACEIGAVETALTLTNADLVIGKSATPTMANPGQPVTYTLAFSNTGGTTATNVVISDVIPAALSDITVQAVPDAGVSITRTTAITYAWTVSDLAPGQGGLITINGTLNDPLSTGYFTNTAYITSTVLDADPSNNIATAVIEVANVAPILAAIGAQSIPETETLSFSLTANDANGDSLTFSLSGAPAGANLNSSTGLFTWLTNETDGPGVYSTTVFVSDGVLSDSETIQITVDEANQAPVLATVDDQTVNEGEVISFTVAATDIDLPIQTLTYSLANAPAGATMDASSGEFTWVTDEADGPGIYPLTVIASDGLTDSRQIVILTVMEGNVAPVLDPIADQTVVAGELLSFMITASDSDLPAQTLTYSLSDGSVGATLDSNSGLFNWTAVGSGVYSATIIVSDGVLTDSQTMSITVILDEVAPVLAAIGPQETNEGTTLSFTARANDVNGDGLTFSLSDAPTDAGIDPTTGLFTWTTDETDGPGVYSATIVVSDGGLTDSETIQITVNEVNQVPILGTVGEQVVNEGELISFTAVATDTDVPTQVVTYTVLAPAGAAIDTFSGEFTWVPGETDGPEVHYITVIASDSELSGGLVVPVTVLEVNVAPVLDPLTNQTIVDGDTLTFTVTASDSDRPLQALTYSLTDGPVGAVLDSKGLFTWTTTAAGVYSATISVSDGLLTDSQTIQITVSDGNASPELADLSDQTIDEGETVSFTAIATDSDGDALTYSLSGAPDGAIIDSSSGAFTWITDEEDGPAVYSATISVSDGLLTDSQTIQITVNEVNEAPVLESLADQVVIEGETVSFTAIVNDQDVPAQSLSFSLSDAPATANIDETSGFFEWVTDETDGPGVYNATVIVSDGTLTDSQTITITVNEETTAPVLDPIAPQTIAEMQTLTFTATAADPDNDALTYGLYNASSGMSIDSSTGEFSWTPTEAQGPAAYFFSVMVTDTTGLTDTMVAMVNVTEVNQAPVLEAIAAQTLPKTQPFSLTVNAIDEDYPANGLSYTMINAPDGAALDESSGLFSWTPEDTQGPAEYTITFVVTDDGTPVLSDTQDVTFTVTNNPGVLITESDGSTDVAFGGYDTYEMVLIAQPTDTVTVTMSTDGQVETIPTRLVFTPDNWDEPQMVSTNAMDDVVYEGPHTGLISHSASSTDPGYDGIGIADVIVNIADDAEDLPVITIGDVTVDENVGTATVPVTLTGESVFATEVSFEVSDGIALGSGVDYNATNGTLTWAANTNGVQTINITIVNDTDEELAETINVALTSVLSGTIDDGNAVVTINANDEPLPEPLLSITKDVTTASTLVKPGDVVTYTISVSNSGEGVAEDVTVQDTLPTYLSGADLDQTVTISANEEIAFTVVGTVDSNIPVGLTTITNTASFSHSLSDGQASATIVVSKTVEPEPSDLLYLSARRNGSVDGLSYADEDILVYDPDADTWAKLFDGSDVGYRGADIDAFTILEDGSLLLSADRNRNLPDVGRVDDSDIVRFIPTSLGENTVGTFEWYFDASDVRLTRGGEDIDAISVTSEGKLLISTIGSFRVPGIGGRDEDLILFTPSSLGENTSGTWERYFDGSDVGLRSWREDVRGGQIDEATGDIYLTTDRRFDVPGLEGEGTDIFICTPTSLGVNTECEFSLYWAGEEYGFDRDIDAFAIGGEVAVEVTATTIALADIEEADSPEEEDRAEDDEDNENDTDEIHALDDTSLGIEAGTTTLFLPIVAKQ